MFTPGLYFDCAVQRPPDGQHRQFAVFPGEFLPHCGTVSESAPGTAHAGGTLVTARPAGFEPGYFTVNCPAGVAGCGAATVLPGTTVALPPHSIAVPLSGGAVSLSGLGPAPISGRQAAQRAPTWRPTPKAKEIIAARLAEVTASLDGDYPRKEAGQMRDSAEAMRTVMGWNTVWDQRVKVITPVSRTFGVNPWIMWDWDTYFASLLAARNNYKSLTATSNRARARLS